MEMPFGKYKNMDLRDIPLHYLQWLEENVVLKEPMHKDVIFEIERRTGDRPGQGKVVKEPK